MNILKKNKAHQIHHVTAAFMQLKEDALGFATRAIKDTGILALGNSARIRRNRKSDNLVHHNFLRIYVHMGDRSVLQKQIHRRPVDSCSMYWRSDVSVSYEIEGSIRMKSFVDVWGNVEYARRGAYNCNASKEKRELPGRPEWLDMIPIKRYATYTRFFKKTTNGNGYFVCYSNSEIDQYKKEHGIE